MLEVGGPWVIRPFNFLLKLKIENWCQFLIFMMFYHKKLEGAQLKIFDYFPFGRTLKWNLYFYFNLVNNEKKNESERQFCFSDNVSISDTA